VIDLTHEPPQGYPTEVEKLKESMRPWPITSPRPNPQQHLCI